MILPEDALTRLHLAAVMERLQDPSALGALAFDDEVAGSPDKYARVFTNSGLGIQTRYSSLRTSKRYTYTIHSVGISPTECLWINDRVHKALDDAQLTVTGRTLQRLEHVVSRPIDIDKAAKPPLHFVVDQFALVSDPHTT